MTEKLLSPLRTRPWPQRWLTRVLGAALASAAYLVCIPWDLTNRVQTPGSDQETTPVTGIGVIGLAWSCWPLRPTSASGLPRLAAALVAVPPAVLMQISFRTHSGPPDGMAHLWPLAWGFFTFLIGAGVLVAAALARRFRPQEEDSLDGLLYPHPT